MNDREVIRSFEGFHNQRFVGFALLALLAFAVAVGSLVWGFRNNHVSRSADAMAHVVPHPTAVSAPTPPSK